MRLSGKVAIVTGGASGIGRAIAGRFAREGASVLITDQNAEGAAAAAAEIGDHAGSLAADVTDAEQCAAMVREVVGRWGGLDVLVNSAGIGDGDAIVRTSEAVWDRVLEVNLKGTYLAARAAFPALVRRGGGSIVNLASLAAFVVAPGLGAYAASKGGVVQLTRVLAIEGAGLRIRANALCPIWTDTPMLRRYLASVGDPDVVLRDWASRIPLGRIATADDVAAAALFLASDEASFITGVALPIDGGMLCQ